MTSGRCRCSGQLIKLNYLRKIHTIDINGAIGKYKFPLKCRIPSILGEPQYLISFETQEDMYPVINMYFPKVARTQLCATLSGSAAPAQDWPHDHTILVN